MKFMNKTALVITGFALVAGFGAVSVSAFATTDTPTMTEPHKMTEEELTAGMKEIQTIQTKFAIYERNDQAKITDQDVVVSNVASADAKTTIIAETYGTFVRK
ncbi:hypothetical protein [Tumebacillus flagellatus]|uniref:Inhibitor I9 domain-containing protein n=1 Tax=Tumebacillus flagellatus TaxID=1157490 RepID=A0A074LGR1_9BACL|nr:hypothetical protein [Tumebacillus flagellatus]KEO81421.1 hypothetical protein EL26_21035 [Tumebacillus flagellatus]